MNEQWIARCVVGQNDQHMCGEITVYDGLRFIGGTWSFLKGSEVYEWGQLSFIKEIIIKVHKTLYIGISLIRINGILNQHNL